MPQHVIGASLQFPVWNVIFQLPGFTVNYESGVNHVPTFDAHIEVYSMDKIVRVNYDTPYVKGLPVTMTIREKFVSENGDGFREYQVRRTYEDPYTLEFMEFWKCATMGFQPKTSAADTKQDLVVFKMILQAGFGTVSGKNVSS